jgi:hypothetical protein
LPLARRRRGFGATPGLDARVARGRGRSALDVASEVAPATGVVEREVFFATTMNDYHSNITIA